MRVHKDTWPPARLADWDALWRELLRPRDDETTEPTDDPPSAHDDTRETTRGTVQR